MKIRFFTRILLIAFAAFLAVPAWTQAAAAVTVTVDGKTVKWPLPPVKSGSTMLVDAKTLLPLVGATYNYDKSKKKLTAKSGQTTLVLTAGSKSGLLNGAKLSLPAAPAAAKSGINIPADVAVRAFGGEVQWVNSSKYDVMSKNKWQAVVTAQALAAVRKLVDAQEKENADGMRSVVNVSDTELAGWVDGVAADFPVYRFDLNLKSAKVTEVGQGYAVVEGVVGYTLLEGPYDLNYDIDTEYVIERIKNLWKITGITFGVRTYYFPDEPAGAKAVQDQATEFVKGITDAFNREDAEAYAGYVDGSIASDEKTRMADFFAEQAQQSEVYDVNIVHIDADGSVYIVVNETIESTTTGTKETYDSLILYKLAPQQDGKLRMIEETSLVFEPQ